jgi:DNA adenine methylase
MLSLSTLTKAELLDKCVLLGITRCKSKTKPALIDLINQKELNPSIANEPVIDTEKVPKKSSKKMSKNTMDSIEPSASNPLGIRRLKPLIKWCGGKADEIKLFQQYIPETYTTYIEPFVGGGSVYFYLNPSSAVIGDVHTELISFYKSIGEGKGEEIYNFMETSPNTEETYYKIRDEMEITSPLDTAKRFYYQRKTCFRGMLRYNKHGKFNIPFGRYKTINYTDLLDQDYTNLLGKTEILNEGFEHMFATYNDDTNFMFLDPPYDSEFTDYGYCKFGKSEHIKLSELFKTTRIKCLMIIGHTKFIEDLYDGYIVATYDKKYRFKIYDNRIGDEINTQHLVIKNY